VPGDLAHVAASAEYLRCFELEGKPIHRVTCDETWVKLSTGKIMISVFWDSEGVIHVDFPLCYVTVNAQCYSNLLCHDVYQAIRKRRVGRLLKIFIVLHDKACPHAANLTKIFAKIGWEIMNHPPYSPDLAPSYFNLLGPVKVHLGGQKLLTDDKLECGVLN
jgi:histone-lysine N-methyltransferase SETMAR